MKGNMMEYKDWYKKGVELGYVKKYTINFMDGLLDSLVDLDKALTPSIHKQLGSRYKDKIEKMGKQSWGLWVLRNMMDGDEYWENTDV